MPWAIGGQEPGGALDLGCELGPVVCDFVPGGTLDCLRSVPVVLVVVNGIRDMECIVAAWPQVCVLTYLLGMSRVLGSGQM